MTPKEALENKLQPSDLEYREALAPLIGRVVERLEAAGLRVSGGVTWSDCGAVITVTGLCFANAADWLRYEDEVLFPCVREALREFDVNPREYGYPVLVRIEAARNTGGSEKDEPE